MPRRFKFTIEFTVDKDGVPGMFNDVNDWIKFITHEYDRQTHYHPEWKVVGPVMEDTRVISNTP